MALLDELGVAAYAERAPRRSCRTRCASGSRWPARWSPSRGCCCSTSRPAASAPTTSTSWPSSIAVLPSRAAGACSVLLVEHHMDLVMKVCDQIVVLDFGRRHRGRHAGSRSGTNPAVAEAYLGAEVDAESTAIGDSR